MNMTDSAPNQRQNEITDLLRAQDFLSVEELAARFEVTTQTIRRDINQLCEMGAARRLHGGIVRMAGHAGSGSGNMSFRDREVLNRAAKMQIAATVAKHIPNGASVSFGIGTTPRMVAEHLGQHRNLKIVTNNLSIALTMAMQGDFEVTMAGGQLRNSDLDVCSVAAEEMFAGFRVDIAVFGVGGIDPDGTLLDFSGAEVRIREAMRTHARRSFLVLDATKFGRVAHVRGGRIEEASAIFCDAPLPEDMHDFLAQSGAEFVICPPVS
ncbi:MAG: DeoR/GlpR family DNA-binding transcription regulator [Heliomarina sp.]|uniref:DeoR/GlpR family DNA-binding transcription regulator n=1 Tax=Heliomarina sp. TaxID=2917556 RepID=UPI004058C43E